MSLPSAIHDLPVTGEQDGRELTIHPSAVETERGLLLLDAGLPGQLDALRAALDDVEWGLGDVESLLVTHRDGDHAGGVAALSDAVADETGDRPRTFAHPDAAPYLDGRREPDAGRHYEPFPIDVEVTDGTTFRTEAGPLRLLHTPGHSPGHLSAYAPEERTLISADALTARDGLAGPPPEFSLDMREATASVGRLADLRIRRVLTYHGGLVSVESGAVERIYDDLAAEHDVS